MAKITGTVTDASGNPAPGRIVRAYRRDTGVLVGRNVTSGGSLLAGDPHRSNVLALLHMDGADGSTTFTDSSPSALSVTRVGSPAISNRNGRFGGVSMLGTETGYLTATLASAIGSGDFTIELWASLAFAGTGYYNLVTIGNTHIRFGDSGFGDKLQVATNGISLATEYSCALTKASFLGNAMTHIAFVRSAGVCKLYVSGVAQSLNSGANPSTYPLSSFSDSTNLTSTALQIKNGFVGFVDEVCITKAARYTANFTPPEFPYSDYVGGSALAAGAYEIDTFGYSGEVNVICLDDDAGTLENDLILRTYPV